VSHRIRSRYAGLRQIQLSNVLSDLSGVSGMNIIQAILEGERDPQTLAALVMPGVKATPEISPRVWRGTGAKNYCSCCDST